ncbi:hypothetical protein B0H17DRAFT_1146349 [Mycena rosella]|uniref:Uncharacterized protein n=1 Tax=Mycena rosella TaxID=1033263 RepID=A0AAD7CRK5_MYCRO|nr:hypothetical protein B0H17DRAFT_1146349 [Mycena rosella]
MHPYILAALFGLQLPQTLAAPLGSGATAITPGGYRLNTSIHPVPLGGRIAHVGGTMHVLDAAGDVVQIASPATRKTAPVPEEQQGWIAYASWLNSDSSSPISSFTTTWTVPQVPAADHGQTIFLFNSIEPASGDAIMQPVLQYGPSAAGGGDFWTVATPGQTLTGTITLVSQSDTTYSYNAQFTNIDGTALAIDGNEQLAWATETLEAYGVTEADDYPAGSTVFSGINIALASGAVPDVAWGNADDVADGLAATVDVDGATDAQIRITY